MPGERARGFLGRDFRDSGLRRRDPGRLHDHGPLAGRKHRRRGAWLEAELKVIDEPTIMFVHQRLDGEGAPSIRNREAVRKILEIPSRVLAVFQGHHHPDGYSLINGIHYYTLRAVIEGSGEANNAYALFDVSQTLDISVTGYRRAVSAVLPKPPAAPAALPTRNSPCRRVARLNRRRRSSNRPRGSSEGGGAG